MLLQVEQVQHCVEEVEALTRRAALPLDVLARFRALRGALHRVAAKVIHHKSTSLYIIYALTFSQGDHIKGTTRYIIDASTISQGNTKKQPR